MISKPVAAKSFYHTGKYICQKPGAEVLLAEGVRAYDYKQMVADFECQHQLRPGKEIACFHSILSFHPTEKPSDEILRTIAQEYLSQLGIVNTQFAIIKHTDKMHLHLHLMANMVNNDGKAISDSYIGLRGKKVAEQLTRKYNLMPAIKRDLSVTPSASLNDYEAARLKIGNTIFKQLPYCRTMEDLRINLQREGIETLFKYKGQTQEIQGISFKIRDFQFKGSEIDRKFSYGNLKKILGQLQLERLKSENNQQQQGIPRLAGQKVIYYSNEVLTKGDIGLDIEKELQQALGTMLKILFQYEYSNDSLAYEFTAEAYERRKKKQKYKRKM